jgi:ribosomal protein S8
MKLKHLTNAISIIKNGYQRNVTDVTVLNTLHIQKLLICLWKAGYIQGYSVVKNSNLIRISLKYVAGKKCLNEIDLITKPSWKKFTTVENLIIKTKRNKWNDFIVLTSKGIFNLPQLLKNSNQLGGILLCCIK